MKITTWQRDDLGRVIRYKDIGQDPVTLAYDAYDLPVYAADNKEEWHLEYTPMGNLKKQIRKSRINERDIRTLQLSYDAYDNLRAISNEKGERYTFIRDANDRVTEEKGFDGIIKQYIRNSDGLIIKTVLPEGKHIYHDYDLAGRLTFSKYDDGYWQSFQYDASGLLSGADNPMASITFTRNVQGLIVQETQGEHVLNFTYDRFSNLTGLQSSLGITLEQGYDRLRHLTTIRASQDHQPWTASISRDPQGRELNRALSGGIVSSFEYDHEGRPVSQKVNVQAATAIHKQYSWHNNDKLASCLNLVTGGKISYNYNAFEHLTAAAYENNEIKFKSPDETGNLFKTPDRSDRIYGKGGKLLKDDNWYYRYDSEGNLVHKSKRNINKLRPQDSAGEKANAIHKWAWVTTDKFAAGTSPRSNRYRLRLRVLPNGKPATGFMSGMPMVC